MLDYLTTANTYGFWHADGRHSSLGRFLAAAAEYPQGSH